MIRRWQETLIEWGTIALCHLVFLPWWLFTFTVISIGVGVKLRRKFNAQTRKPDRSIREFRD